MPDQFSHYEILSPLGAGGMGKVFRARDTQLDRDVALKILPEAFAEDPERLARFEREAKLLAQLNHTNIASIYSLAKEGEKVALALEYVEGEELTDRISRGPIPPEEALEIASHIADALEAAHNQGIVHRDLKPANIKITPDGTVKVLDFGLAKAMDPATDATASPTALTQSPTALGPGSQTEHGIILGTAAYMSPEQASGRPVDKRADIWAWGVILFEMLAGERPFEGETIPELLASTLKDAPAWEKLPPGLPTPLRRLLQRCLRKKPDQRQRDIGDARMVLEEFIETGTDAYGFDGSGSEGGDGARGGARPSPFDDGQSSGPRRVRGRPPKSLVVGFVVLALLLAAFVGWNLPRLGTAPVRTQKLDMVADGMYLTWFSGPTISPDGRRLAYVAGSGVWVRDLDGVEARRVADVDDRTSVFWSPDGAHIG